MPFVRAKRLGFETLEKRELLAADLHLVSVQFANANGAITGATPVVGEKVYASIHYLMTDLTAANAFQITWTMDGVTTTQPAFPPYTFTGVPGTNVDGFWYHGGFVATPGPHTLTVTVDSGNTVAEANEANNSISVPFTPVAPTTLPNKFALPLGGTQNVNWTLEGYVDVDGRGFLDDPFYFYKDYQGNTTATRDFHNGLDFRIPTFAAQDAGVPVLAAAGGTVVAINDGEFDREIGLQFANVGNYVFIDHGNGWVSQYYHLREGSLTVGVGNVVTAGQTIGLVGSSGNSGASHVHFEIQHNGTPVDPFQSPSDYFLSPPPYINALPPSLLDFGVTNDFPSFDQVREKVSDIDTFPTSGKEVFAWAIFPVVEAGDTWRAQLYRPDGTLVNNFSNVTFTQPTDFDDDGDTDGIDFLTWQRGYGITSGGGKAVGNANPFQDGAVNGTDLALWDLQYGKTLMSGWSWSVYRPGFTENIPGTWRVDYLYNNVKVAEKSFQVNAIARPEIRVFEQSSNYPVIDGRTTPIDFGDATQNGAGLTKTFKVENHGYANLAISSVTVPTGFTVTEPLSATIAAGASDTFTVQLNSSVLGLKSGQITINSNDVSEAVYNFAIEGEVVAPLQAFFFNEALLDGTDATDRTNSGSLLESEPLAEPVLRTLAENRVAVAPAAEPTDRARVRELRPTVGDDEVVDEAFDLLGDDTLL